MRDLGLALIAAGLVLAAIAAVARLTRTRPQPRHTVNPPGEEDTFVAELRGQPWDAAPRPDHPTATMVPLYGADDAPSPLGQLLKPLPKLTDEEIANLKARFAEAVKNAGVILPPAQPDADDDIRHAAEHFNPRPGDKPPRPPHATDTQTTGEIFEHLCNGPDCWCRPWTPTPDTPPAEVVQGLNGHYTVDAAVESMFTRAQAAQVRALANGQVSDG
jgi:hypothetical protein